MPIRAPGWLAVLGVAAVALGVQLPFYDRWVSFMDEGHILAFADVLAKGGELYRDAWLYPLPGAFYLLAWAFRALGTSILVAREIVVAEFAVFVAAVFCVLRRLVSPSLALGGVALLLVYRIWAFPHWQMYSYSTTALCLLGETSLHAGEGESVEDSELTIPQPLIHARRQAQSCLVAGQPSRLTCPSVGRHHDGLRQRILGHLGESDTQRLGLPRAEIRQIDVGIPCRHLDLVGADGVCLRSGDVALALSVAYQQHLAHTHDETVVGNPSLVPPLACSVARSNCPRPSTTPSRTPASPRPDPP